MSDPWLDALNHAVFGTPLPFADRPCGRLDAAFRQAPELSPEDIEAALEAAAREGSNDNER